MYINKGHYGRQKKATGNKKSNGAGISVLNRRLWQAADKMRGHMDSAEYRHIVLGLIFLKYISDAFEERRNQLQLLAAEPTSEYHIKENRLATAP
jgi:type I restriction enzyme M protein